WVEGPAGPTRLARMHPADVPPITPETVLERAVWASDHLLAATFGPTGLVRQRWDPVRTTNSDAFDLFWHAHGTWALGAAFHRTRFVPYGEAAERALRALLEVSQVDDRSGPHGGGSVRWVSDHEQIHTGVVALSLLAVAEHRAAFVVDDHLDAGRQLALYLISVQAEGGRFNGVATRDPAEPPTPDGPEYYTSEATLALLRWHAVDPDERWLDAALRGLEHRARVDADAGERLKTDFWLMMALAEARATHPDPRWVGWAERLAAAAVRDLKTGERAARQFTDLAGGGASGSVLSSAVRVEGLSAAIEMLRASGRPTADLEAQARGAARHVLAFQYTPESHWWVRAPSRTLGGFSSGPGDPSLRADVHTHALGALLGLERVLSSERLPGTPGWSLDDSRAFHGVDRAMLRPMRVPSRANRVPSVWELGLPEVDPHRGLGSTTP
ncbi:MAG: hypothetical protein ACI9K2_007247, partial [Myxococcota bacterium]